MSNDPDQIRADIEATRRRLSDNVDTLTEEAKPSTIARHQVDKVKDAGAGLKDKIMGSGDAGSVQDAVGSAPDTVRRKTEGNPLAAGLIAFGLGALVASLIPASQQERQAAAGLKANLEPVKQQVGDIAKDAAANLKGPAQEAGESVKQTATEAAGTVRDQGQSAAEDVRGQAQESAETVQQTRSS